MFTNKARLLVTAVFVSMMLFFVYQHMYELAAVAALFAGLLMWGYFKEGTIILAAKQFHIKNYDAAESLLLQIKNPALLSKQRRGFYEFIMGGIRLQQQDYAEAEKHYETAAQYPLRSLNDHVAALVHIVNINIRLGNYHKAESFLQMAEAKADKISAKMKAVINRLEQELKTHKN